MADRLRMISAPGPALEPQIGWTYEVLPTGDSGVCLRAVELPDGTVPSIDLRLHVPISDVPRHFIALDEEQSRP